MWVFGSMRLPKGGRDLGFVCEFSFLLQLKTGILTRSIVTAIYTHTRA